MDDTPDDKDIEALENADAGGSTQQRYRYQACQAARFALLLLSEPTKYSHLYCELDEDIVLCLHNGSRTLIQAKTRAIGLGPFVSTNEDIVSTIYRFVDYEFQKKDIARYIISTNCGYATKTKKDDLFLDLNQLKGSIEKESTAISPMLQTWLDRIDKNKTLASFKIAPERHQALISVFKKLHFDDKLKELINLETNLVHELSQLDQLKHLGMSGLTQTAKCLIDRMQEAASLGSTGISLIYLCLEPEPEKTAQAGLLNAKKITKETVETAILAATQNFAAPARSFFESNFEEIKKLIMLGAPSLQDDEKEKSPGTNSPLISFCRELIREGKYLTAHKKLRSLSEDTSTTATLTDFESSLLENLLGVCCLYENKLKEAEDHFVVALKMRNDYAAAKANFAQLHLLRGNFDEAEKFAAEAVKLDENDDYANSILIQAQSRNGEGQIKVTYSEEFLNVHPLCLCAFAQYHIDRADFGGAKNTLKRALDIESSDRHQIILSYAHACFNYIQAGRRLDDSFVVVELTAEQHDELKELISLLNESVSHFKPYEIQDSYLRGLYLRAAIKCDLGDAKGALEDAEDIISAKPEDQEAWRIKAGAHLKDTNYESAATAFAHCDSKHSNNIVPHVFALQKAKKYDDAIELAESWCKSPKVLLVDKLLLIDLLVSCFEAIGKTEAALKAFDEIKVGWGETAMGLHIIAERLCLWKKETEALELLEESVSKFESDFDKDLLHLSIGAANFQILEFQKALDAYQSIKSQRLQTELREKQIVCRIKIGDYAGALAEIDNIRTQIKHDDLLDAEIELLAYMGELQRALDLNEQRRKISDSPYKICFSALLFLRLGFSKESADLAIRLKVEDVSDNPQLAIKAGWLFHTMKKFDLALEILFEAVRRNPNAPELYQQYIRASLTVPDDSPMIAVPKVVEIGSAVYLQGLGERKRFIIKKSGTPNFLPDEISAECPLAEKLLGKQVGEQVTIRDDQYGKSVLVIEQIQTQYGALLADCFSDFEARFPENKSMIRVDSTHAEIKLLASLDDREKYCNTVLDLYSETKICSSAAAELLGIDESDFWSSMINVQGRSLNAFEGDSFDPGISAIFTESKSISLDMMALHNLYSLDLLQVLETFPMPVIVSQFVFDELRGKTLVDDFNHRVAFYGAKVDGKYRMIENKSDTNDESLKLRAHISDTILRSFSRVGARRLFLEGKDHFDKIVAAIGWSAAGTYATAFIEGNLPICDDNVFRLLINSTVPSCKAASSFHLLFYLEEIGTLTKEERLRRVETLILQGTRRIPISTDQLVFALESRHWEPSADVIRIFERLSDPNLDTDSVARVITGFLRELWTQLSTSNLRLIIFDAIVRSAMLRRNDRQALALRLAQLINHNFRDLPTARSEIIGALSLNLQIGFY